MAHRILLVEDEPGLVMTLTDRLEIEGYELESCTDGENGLERASTSGQIGDHDVSDRHQTDEGGDEGCGNPASAIAASR